MAVKINRYKCICRKTDAYIYDRLYDEKIVEISTRNNVLTENLIKMCIDYLNEGIETNDKPPINKSIR